MEADTLPTTHSVATYILDTEDCETKFDSITYSKGAALLRYFVNEFGIENFGKALKKYFKENAWNNATRQNFFDTLK